MTDGLEAARRSDVAKSFRYARAFYDEAEAAGPAEFERNRQAIIDVIALAYRDGKASARASESALRAAAQAVIVRGSLVGRCLECWQTDGAHTDKCDLGRLKAALDGAPYSPDMALKAAAREVMNSYEAYVALGSARGIDSAGSPPKPEDQWDEYDYMMIPAWRRLKSALDGAPWEPSEEVVERVAQAVRETVLGASPWEVDDWTLVARAALKAGMGIESGSAG